jgi:hypothetical protein
VKSARAASKIERSGGKIPIRRDCVPAKHGEPSFPWGDAHPEGAAKFKQAVQLWRKAQGRFEKAFGSARAAKLRSELKLLTSEGFEDAF